MDDLFDKETKDTLESILNTDEKTLGKQSKSFFPEDIEEQLGIGGEDDVNVPRLSDFQPQKRSTNRMTERTLKTALDKVAQFEGGYVKDPQEGGGEANHGITLSFLRSVRPGATSNDLRSLTKEEARQMFDTHFIRKPGIDKLPDVAQAEMVGLSINAGPKAAIKVLQRAAGVKADGVIGPKTIEAVKRLSNEQIGRAVDDFYINLVERVPKNRRFLKGWLNRSKGLNAIPEDFE